MSRPAPSFRLPPKRFPRVSGDEPTPTETSCVEDRFSPRERG